LVNKIRMRTDMKIYMEIIAEPVSGTCAVTGKKVKYAKGYGFFADGKLTKPVAEAEALKAGFSVKPKTMKSLAKLIDAGRKFEEVQRASREEFATWEAL
jgi:phenylacetate-coenzyme A ligase PaaK-like adenylate-forming protein